MGKGRGKKRRRGKDGGKGGKGDGGTRGKGPSEGKGKGKRRGLLGALPERAFLVSSDSPQMSPKATREAQRLLGAALEALGAAGGAQADAALLAAAAPRETAPERRSASDLLEAELQELRGGGAEGGAAAKRPRIAFHGEVTRGIAALACPSRGDAPDFPAPSALAAAVFEAQRGEPTARFVVRLFPLDVVCAPHLSNFRGAAEKALPAALAGAAPGATWYMAFSSRAMTTIKRDDALAVLKEVLGPLGLDISVSDAEYTVLVEVNPSLCGFSVLRDYAGGLRECHLQRASRARDTDEEDSSEESDGSLDGEGDPEKPAVGAAGPPDADAAADAAVGAPGAAAPAGAPAEGEGPAAARGPAAADGAGASPPP